MRTYIKAYRDRKAQIVLALTITIALLLGCFLLFHSKVATVSKQLDTYQNSDFSRIYVLNYQSGLDNEFIFVDTDVGIFKDDSMSTRLAVSTIMVSPDTTYNLSMFEDFSKLQENEVILSENVSKDYGIKKDDVVYAAFSYNSEILYYKVADIIDFNLDYCNPSIANNIGVVYLGFNIEYQQNINCKYMLFANQSIAEELSNKPQILNSIINKSDNESFLLRQGFASIIIVGLCSIASVVLSSIIFFSKSHAIIMRCYLKGMNKAGLFLIPLLEKSLFNLLPSCLVSGIYAILCFDCGHYLHAYCLIPVCVSIVFIFGSFVIDVRKTKRRDN